MPFLGRRTNLDSSCNFPLSFALSKLDCFVFANLIFRHVASAPWHLTSGAVAVAAADTRSLLFSDSPPPIDPKAGRNAGLGAAPVTPFVADARGTAAAV